MPSNEVRSELGTKLLESAKGVRRQLTEPNSHGTLQCCKESPTHDFIRDPLKVHQGLEGL